MRWYNAARKVQGPFMNRTRTDQTRSSPLGGRGVRRCYAAAALLALFLSSVVVAAPRQQQDALPITRGAIVRDTARVTFEWQKPVKFSLGADGRDLIIRFSRSANPNFVPMLAALHPYVVGAKRRDDGRTIVLTLDKPYRVRPFTAGSQSGVEILGIDPAARKEAILSAKAAKKNAEKLQANADTGKELAELAPAAGPAKAAPATEPAKPAEAAKPEEQPKAEEATSAKENTTETTKQEPAKNAEQQTDDAARPMTEASQEQAQAVTTNKVSISAADDSATLRFPLDKRTAFAVFTRNHYLWIVLGRQVKLDLSEFEEMAKTVIGKPSIIENSKATVLYMPMDDNVYTTVTKEEDSDRWVVLVTQTKKPPKNPIAVEVNTTPPAPSHIFLPVLEMADTIVVRDPQVGDSLVITPLFNPGEGVSVLRSFVEFNLLDSTQGIAVAKKADDVTVMQLRNGLRITTKRGASITPDLPKVDEKKLDEGVQANPTLFPYALWKTDSPIERRRRIQGLMREIVSAGSVQDANNARLRLAQLYLGEGMAAESIAVLDVINRTNPSFYRSAKLNALRGAGNFLMYRFIESARDFAASELNNNKEVGYWRAVLSDLLGNAGQTYDFLEMNPDYISKYPPLFRQRLVIVAADRAIGAKEYNTALRIFDTLQQENLLESINVYIKFLMAKISMSTGQQEDANEALDKIAEDMKYPFVRARAEFTRIARDMEAGMSREKAKERLERLRLGWHGDGLELQVLTLLGDLYYEDKDYVNAMRVWNNAVQSFPNTAGSIEMTSKMQEAFIVMFNEGATDRLPPLEALAIYYEYRNYMPRGIAGNEMMERLADRLIGIDLLDQAAELLDRQMRSQTEKEARSKLGAKLAATHLMSHQPEKALSVLQDSVYGENPVLLRLLRNRLTAEAMVELKQYDKAMQTLGQDDSDDAERIRIAVYWQERDWPKLTASVERLLKARPDITAPVSIDESEQLMKLALAYVFQNNKEQLQYLRDYFGPLMADSPNQEIFDFITRGDITPNSRNFDQVMQSLTNTRSFVDNYRAKIKLSEADRAAKAEAGKAPAQ
jgi:tetratricopeptide (TPR) repeat protein